MSRIDMSEISRKFLFMAKIDKIDILHNLPTFRFCIRAGTHACCIHSLCTSHTRAHVRARTHIRTRLDCNAFINCAVCSDCRHALLLSGRGTIRRVVRLRTERYQFHVGPQRYLITGRSPYAIIWLGELYTTNALIFEADSTYSLPSRKNETFIFFHNSLNQVGEIRF